MLAGQTRCLGEVRAGWWVAGWREAPPPGALWRQARVRSLSSSSWTWQEIWAVKCPWQDATTQRSSCTHGQDCPVSDLTAPLAGWPKPGPQASALYRLLFPTGPACGQALGLPP